MGAGIHRARAGNPATTALTYIEWVFGEVVSGFLGFFPISAGGSSLSMTSFAYQIFRLFFPENQAVIQITW